MNSAVINIKTDPKVKQKASKIASSLGFSLSSLINGYLRQLVKTKTVNFTLKDEEPSEYMLKAIREAEEDVRTGDIMSFKSTDQSLDFIDEMINDGKKN